MSAAPSDTITLARPLDGSAALAKTIVVRGATIAAVQPARHVGTYGFEEHAVQDLESLTAVLEHGARTNAIAVRGRPKAATGRRAIYDDPEKGPAGLEVVPRRLCAFDWDGLPLEPQSEPQPPEIAEDEAEFCNWSLPDPPFDADIGAAIALRRLPPAFRDCSCIWQISASAGFKPGFRLRTWHWLDHPTTGAELKTWLTPAIRRGMVDPVTLVECHPHYLAVRAIVGPTRGPAGSVSSGSPGMLSRSRTLPTSPVGSRSASVPSGPRRPPIAILDGARPTPIAASRRATPRSERPPMARDTPPTSLRPPVQRRCATATGSIGSESGRSSSLAYENTLKLEEARQRRRTSTLGVLAWLERRSAA